LRFVEVQVQLADLVTQRLKFRFGLDLAGVARFFRFGGKLVQIAFDAGQLPFHFVDEIGSFRVGVILCVLRGFLAFCFNLFAFR